MPDPQFSPRDGTSQSMRALASLDPSALAIDERSLDDWLKFAHRIAEQLPWASPTGNATGTWSELLSFCENEEMLRQLGQILSKEGTLDSRRHAPLTRPHVVLLVAFLEALSLAQDNVNDFTRRHLHFFYREVLRFAARPSGRDHLHLLLEPAPSPAQQWLPAGSRLLAGKDDAGEHIEFTTDQDVTVSQARLVDLRSAHVVRRVIGPKEVRANPEVLLNRISNDPLWIKSDQLKEKSFLALLDLTLRDPQSQVAKVTYPDANNVLVPLSAETLYELDQLVGAPSQEIGLSIPTFQAMMELKHFWDLSEPATRERWTRVQELLVMAATARLKGAPYAPPPVELDDFPARLDHALELPENAFDGLPKVEDIYGLYRHLKDTPTQLLETFLAEKIYLTQDKFQEMMQTVDAHHQAWRQIQDTLRAAARRRNPQHREARFDLRPYYPDRLDRLVRHHLGELRLPTVCGQALAGLEDLDTELRRLELTLHLPAEDFRQLRGILSKDKPSMTELERAFDLLRQTRTRYAARARQARLAEAFGASNASGWDETIQILVQRALGEPNPGDPLPDDLQLRTLDPSRENPGDIRNKLYLGPEDVRFLQSVQKAGPYQPLPSELTRPFMLPPDGAPLRPTTWDRVFGILDQAQRRKRGTPVVALEFSYVENVFLAKDATQVRTRSVAAGPETTSRWRTFGDGQREDGATQPAPVGFLIASPILALSEGTRQIQVTLFCDAATADESAVRKVLDDQLNRAPFRFFVSTAKGWFELPAVPMAADRPPLSWERVELNAQGETAPALCFALRLSPNEPAVEALPTALDAPFAVPAIEVRLADHVENPGDTPGKLLSPFATLRVIRVRLVVQVEGLQALQLQNDESLLDPQKPFEPFGGFPVAGSRFIFAHEELCRKRLDSLVLGLEWMGKPEDLVKHYSNYHEPASDPFTSQDVFQARLIRRDRQLQYELEKSAILFTPTQKSVRWNVSESASITVDLPPAQDGGSRYDHDWASRTAGDPLQWDRCWMLELGQTDFQHTRYPVQAANLVARANPPAEPAIILNPPYTPKLKRLRAYYRSTLEWDLRSTDTAPHAFLHLEPFGYARTSSNGDSPGAPLLPELRYDGELLLGFADVEAPQNLSVLFQAAPGSADPEAQRSDLRWSYATGDTWRDLNRGGILDDSTHGLRDSGIITFSLPVASPAFGLPRNRYWLRASLSHSVRSVADLVAIQPHAVRATYAPSAAGNSRSTAQLPPNSVTALVDDGSGIAGVSQPYSSFAGTPGESDDALLLRVAERLRHKERALTAWDYERLVLERFPEVYKVKCLGKERAGDPATAHDVRVILIPNIRGQTPFDPFEPRVSGETLEAVEAFLRERSSPLARIRVQNPRFAVLQLRFSVRLRPGCNPGFYLPRLEDELRRFLAPWAYEESADIVLGGQVNSSLLVNFIETRPYVDFMASLKLFLSEEGQSPGPLNDEQINQRLAQEDSVDLILVSARQHFIDLLEEEVAEDASFTGIRHMKIELDFVVA